jgi:pyruvate dehydrogenase E2 component (dihydrolipoamide acetyltransferase)
MPVSVSMPQLGESVTEGTVTRWLKKEGERVEADEPLLEVSTDKVDTEIPSPVSGILRGITVAEDETVAVGAELAVIDEIADTDAAAAAAEPAGPPAPPAPAAPESPAPAAPPAGPAYPDATVPAYPPADTAPPGAAPPVPTPAATTPVMVPPAEPPPAEPPPAEPPPAGLMPPPGAPPAPAPPAAAPPAVVPSAAPPPAAAPPGAGPPAQAPPAQAPPGGLPPAPAPPAPPAAAPGAAPPATAGPPAATPPAPTVAIPPLSADGPYVTPLVRKLAAEHGVNLATVTGTGVGGRIRKQDVLEAARALRESAPAAPAAAAAPAAPATAAAPGAPARAIVPSSLRGTTERMSRARQLIARRMVESLQTSAQLTTVIEADVTAIARLRDRAKADFEAREGVKLSFLPFFALAAVEALKIHPRLNAVIDTEAAQVTYHDAEHLGIAVDTERGLMVPVIRNAGDLNIGGLARKIADLAARTRAGQVSPDDLAGGTFTLTNTGSRGALFDTPIINQPQVGILGTGSVVKRAVVVEDPELGEVITVRSMVYLALTYDHRLVDGADAARFLLTVKDRLEEGSFEAELGL